MFQEWIESRQRESGPVRQTLPVFDAATFLMVLTGWLQRREREVIAYLVEENRVLRGQLGGRRVRLTNDDRRRLAARAQRVGRRDLRGVATIVTPDTLLRWHGNSSRGSGPTDGVAPAGMA